MCNQILVIKGKFCKFFLVQRKQETKLKTVSSVEVTHNGRIG